MPRWPMPRWPMPGQHMPRPPMAGERHPRPPLTTSGGFADYGAQGFDQAGNLLGIDDERR
jgi:hypothetical protein